MTESTRPPRRRWGRFLLYGLGGVVLLLAGSTWFITTGTFRDFVERRLVEELQRSTGGRVEVETVHFTPFRRRVEIRGLTIHGLEKEGDVPLVHLDQLVADIKITSLLRKQIGFHSLVLERPAIHVVFYPGGSTNLPEPLRGPGTGNPLDPLFRFSINRLEVRHGFALWGDETIPLDFQARDVSLQMNYSFLRRYYETDLLVGKADMQWKDCRPFSWMAEAHLIIARHGVEVRSLKATSGRSRVEASGRVKDLEHPQVELNYTTSVDLGEVAAILRRREVQGGVFRATGRGTWSEKDFSATGKLDLQNLEAGNASVAFHDAGAQAAYDVDSTHLRLAQVQAHVLGGTASGSLEIMHWQNSAGQTRETANHGRKPADDGLQRGRVQLRLRGIAIAELAAALSPARQPWKKLNLAGIGEGSLDARWAGSPRNADASVAFDVTAAAHPRSTQLPLEVHLRAAYQGAEESVDIADFRVSTRATQFQAAGRLSSQTALKVSLRSTDLKEWQPVMEVFGESQPIPVVIHGQAHFDGTAMGRLSNFAIAGNLQVEDFESVLPATSRTPEQRMHWDSVIASLHLSPTNIAVRNATLRRAESTIHFDMSVAAQQGKITPQTPFTARVEARNAELADFLPLLGVGYPVRGTVHLQMQASGTQEQPHGEGHIEIVNASGYGESIPRATADLRFAHGEAQVNNLQLAYDAGSVTGAAAYSFAAREYRFHLQGEGFDLARLPHIQRSPMKVAGRLEFDANGAGRVDTPQVNATVRLRQLSLDGETVGDYTLEGVTKGADLHVTGRSQFPQAELSLDGDIRMRDEWPANLTAKFSRLDVDSLLHLYLKVATTGHSSLAGSVQMQGALRRPKDISVQADLSQLHADVQNLKIDNSGPLRFSIAQQVLNLDQVHLVGERTDLTASGTVNLSGERELNLRANGRMNLRLIESLNRDFTSSGVVTMNMTATGTVARPLAQGRVQISNGAIAYIDLPSALSEINGSLLFNQDRLQIETLTAKTGGGQVTFTGYATTYNRQLRFDLGVQGQDVRLRYPPGVSSTASMNLRYVGSSDASTLSGDITVSKLSMTPGFDFATYLAKNAQSTTLPQTNPLLNRIRLDVHVVTTPELRMQTASLRLSGNADLRLRGTAAKPALLGRAEITEGEVYFNGTKYRLERGEISFLNPAAIKPQMDLQASTRVRDYDITLTVSGEADRPVVNYRSEPPLPPADIVALLALGRTREESAQMQQSGQSPFGSEASNAILTEALNATVSSRVQRLFGGSRVKIDPEGLATETTTVARGPAVTIEQQVAGNLTLTYTTNLSQSSQQIIQVEYNVSRNLSIVGLRDQNGVVSIDVRIRRRKQ